MIQLKKIKIPKKVWVPLFLIVVGSFQFYQLKKYEGFKEMAEEIRMLFLLKSNIEKTYKLEPSYTGISNKTLFESQALVALKPQWVSVPFYPGSLGNKYGGDVVVKPFNLNEQTQDNKSYSISYPRVPSEYCPAIIFMMSDAFSQILVNQKPVALVGLKKDFPNEFKNNEKLCEAKENTLTLISFAKP